MIVCCSPRVSRSAVDCFTKVVKKGVKPNVCVRADVKDDGCAREMVKWILVYVVKDQSMNLDDADKD